MHGSVPASSLDALFRPRAVAVIGASATPAKIGGTPVHYLKSRGYAGRILPINPKAPEIQGLPAYPTVGDAPGPVDLAIVAVPAALAQGALEDCAAAGVKGVVMFSAGFAEVDQDGAEAQEKLRRTRAGGRRPPARPQLPRLHEHRRERLRHLRPRGEHGRAALGQDRPRSASPAPSAASPSRSRANAASASATGSPPATRPI